MHIAALCSLSRLLLSGHNDRSTGLRLAIVLWVNLQFLCLSLDLRDGRSVTLLQFVLKFLGWDCVFKS